MALESLKAFEYSTKTDVYVFFELWCREKFRWAYGILLYELFSLGQIPYISMDNSEILPFLEEGKRIERPEYCLDEMYPILFV